jgi:hypothetical protein
VLLVDGRLGARVHRQVGEMVELGQPTGGGVRIDASLGLCTHVAKPTERLAARDHPKAAIT